MHCNIITLLHFLLWFLQLHKKSRLKWLEKQNRNFFLFLSDDDQFSVNLFYRGCDLHDVYYWNRSIYSIDLRPAFWTIFFPSVANNLPIVSRKTDTYSYCTVGKNENNLKAIFCHYSNPFCDQSDRSPFIP